MIRRDWQAKGERQWRRYWVQATVPWPDQLRFLLRHVDAWKTYRYNGTRRRGIRGWWSDHYDRAIREGYLAMPRHRGTVKLLVLTDAGRALLATPELLHQAQPYAKRRAGMAEFRELNRRETRGRDRSATGDRRRSNAP